MSNKYVPPCLIGMQHKFNGLRGRWICDWCKVEVPEEYRMLPVELVTVKPQRTGWKRFVAWLM